MKIVVEIEFADCADWGLSPRSVKEVTSNFKTERGLWRTDIRSIQNKRNSWTFRRCPFNHQELDVKPLSSLAYLHLTMMAKPVGDREIYKVIRKNRFRSFIEIGMGDGTRAENMIRVNEKYGVSPNTKLTGLDEFDGRDESEQKLSLIEMHRRLKAYGNAKTQLVPGDLKYSIAKIANSHLRTDLIVISAKYQQQLDAETWFYFPRMLHAGSVVLIQRENGGIFETLNRLQIEKMTETDNSRQAVAA